MFTLAFWFEFCLIRPILRYSSSHYRTEACPKCSEMDLLGMCVWLDQVCSIRWNKRWLSTNWKSCTCQCQAPPIPGRAEVGICKVVSLNPPPLGTVLLYKSPHYKVGISKGIDPENISYGFIKYVEGVEYRPYAMGRTQLIFLCMLRKYAFLEMGWRGKHDFTVLNNGVLREGNDLVKRQKACETFTYSILQGYYAQSQPEG